jgi:acetolactate synthase-1/2/3 large subunit
MAETVTGAHVLIEALAAHGIRYLFGIPGVHTLLPYDLLHNHPQVTPVVTRHEAGAGFAADGYARATGEPGVCLVVPGPGTTNIATAALVAKSDSVPLVIITAAVPAALEGRYAIHELDLVAFMRPLVKAQIEAHAVQEIGAALQSAMQQARTEPPGPVHVLIPYNLFGAQIHRTHDSPPHETDHPAPTASEPDAAALGAALALLRDAHAPLIYAGHGVLRAGAARSLTALAEALNAPVITSNKARGAISEDHPLSVGIPSMAGVAAIARGADVCLALGTHFNEYTTLTWKVPLPQQLIRVDRDDAALDMNYPASVRVLGDAGRTLDWLLERLPERNTTTAAPLTTAALRQQRASATASFMAEHQDSQPPFHPRFVARSLREAMPTAALFTSDGSLTESWLYESSFTVTQPGTVFVPEVQQTMGYAVGAALGAALGMPGRRVTAVVGDGSLMMTLGELATIAAMKVPVTVIVFNDGQYNALRVRQEAIFDKRYVGTDLGTLDFAQVARGLGMRGERVASVAELRRFLGEALSCREPMLVDVPITPEPLSERYTAVIEAGG